MNTVVASVVICTRGRPLLLRRAIDSVLAQTAESFELIVVVDGPDPATEDALRQISDPRLRVLLNPFNIGAGPSRDRGAKEAQADWVAFLDDDDEWLPGKLEKQLLLTGDGAAVITTLSEVRTARTSLTMPREPYDGSLRFDEWMFDRRSWLGRGAGFFQTSSIMLPRRFFVEAGFGDVRHEDWEVGIRAANQFGYRVLTVAEPLVIHNRDDARPSLSQLFDWQRSVAWADGLRPLLSRRAYSGFLLTVVSRAAAGRGARSAALPLLRTAFAQGQPTLRQLFAYALTWLVPLRLRRGGRALLDGRAKG